MSEKIPSAQSGTTVAVIVVNYRTAALTIACVESLLRSAEVPSRIVVVDNASGDGSAEQIAARFAGAPSVEVLARTINDGYAGGNNAGVAHVRGVRYAFVLNSDTTVSTDCVRLLVDEARREANVALATPRIFFGDPPDRLWFGGARFSMWRGRPVQVGYGKSADRGFAESRDLTFATGCALLVDLELVGDGELFDASLFSYAEDLDLSLRVTQAGHRIRYVPQAIVHHFVGSSHLAAAGGGQSLRFYLSTRNLLRVVTRYARWYHWLTLAPMLGVDVIGRYCAVAVRDRDPSAFAAVLRGAWHAMVGGKHQIEPHPE